MSWTSLILASAVFLALYDLAKKASVRDNAVLPTLLISTCFGCVAYVAGVALCGRLGNATVMTRLRLVGLMTRCSILLLAFLATRGMHFAKRRRGRFAYCFTIALIRRESVPKMRT